MKVPVAMSRDDTVHGVYYYKAAEADLIIAALVQERDAISKLLTNAVNYCNELEESRNTYQVEADKLAAENKTLRDALEDVHNWSPDGSNAKNLARAALGVSL